ncbi:vascular cell adhesion protein 1 isoform X2 [Astyanax mexicanus]|uniref:vascular cell adhesion protein 1 isoform X2 n=1 Tax=Astyanax mexicanus TaxID=7994 RepID=UPI0020CB19D5|nr:vascular cell adhesion protein 1 isoform X2 [Astyanax mexicanus]
MIPLLSQIKSGGKPLIWMLLMTSLSLKTGAVKVQIHPRSVVKHVNESLELVCTALDCQDEPKYTWRGILDTIIGGKMESGQKSSRRVYNQLTIEDEKTILCKVNCGGHGQATANVKVYSFPSDPVLSRLNHSALMCRVSSLYPVNMFTLEWLRGEKVISNWEDPGNYEKRLQDIRSLYTPSEEDLGKNITCRVTLSLDGVPEDRKVRSVTAQYGPAFLTTSSNTTVKIGERLELKCDADGKSSITWRKLEKSEAIPITTNRVHVIEKATSAHAGVYECEASAELASRRSRVSVTVKAPPMNSTVLVYPSTQVMEAQNITIHCSTVSFPPASITLSREGNEPGSPSPNGIFHLFNITSEDTGTYMVNFTNELGYETLTIEIMVKGPPNAPFIRLSQRGNPKAGDNVTIICDSDSPLRLNISGASLNQVEKHGSSVSVNLPSIQLRDSGLYHCEARNAFGSKRSSVNVTVRAPPMNSTVLVYPSTQVMEAQNITIHCSTVSFPPASITLSREGNEPGSPSPNGIFHLFNITSEDTGTYMVNFTNELGYETLTIEIMVKGQQSILTKTLIPSVSSVSLLTAAALLMRRLIRSKKKDSFGPSLDDALEVL